MEQGRDMEQGRETKHMDRKSEDDGALQSPSPWSEGSLTPKTRSEDDIATEQNNLKRELSRLSVRLVSKYPPQVKKSERRGLLARFALIPEIYEPYLYPNKSKWVITFTVALAAAAAPAGSAIVMPCLTPIAKEFHTSPTIANLSVALYMLSMAIFPLWWSSFSETLGRRTIYLTSFIFFIIFGILSAISTNISMLIVMRVLSGGAAASVQAVGAGTIADIWEPKDRGKALGCFYLGPLTGPLIAPIVGGLLTQGFNWRATQWFLVIYGGVVITLVVFALPETLSNRKSLAQTATEDMNATEVTLVAATGETGNEKGVGDPLPPVDHTATLKRTPTAQMMAEGPKNTAIFLKRAFIDPLKILLLLRFPAIALTVYYASITFGALYFLNISIEDSFSSPPYNFSVLIVGLLYIPNSLGYILASIFGGRWLDYIMKREARKAGRYDGNGNLVFTPQDRMRENAWIAAFIFPAALVWYGWSVQYGTHWIVPEIANFFFGAGSMLVFAMSTTMLTEFMPRKASTAIAVSNFVRNFLSCIAAIAADPLIKAMGNGWMCTMLAIIAFLSGPVVILSMKRYGDKWRKQILEQFKD